MQQVVMICKVVSIWLYLVKNHMSSYVSKEMEKKYEQVFRHLSYSTKILLYSSEAAFLILFASSSDMSLLPILFFPT